jgi:hypothetical protein
MRPGRKARRVRIREYLNEEQRREPGCSAGRMQRAFHHGLGRKPKANGQWLTARSYASLCTMSGPNAGRQIATYSAPSASGVL